MLSTSFPVDLTKWENILTTWMNILGDRLQPALDACKNGWNGELLQRK